MLQTFVNFSLQIGLKLYNKKMFLLKRTRFANCTELKHDIQRFTSEHFKFSQICKVDYTDIPSVKITKLFTFKIVKMQSRNSNQYKVVFTRSLNLALIARLQINIMFHQAGKWCFTLNLLAYSQKPVIRHISKQFNEFIPQSWKMRIR
ncbi:Hypothetical_protein [Hexamita inflata]|uniref:Hypothetical_protein n=1 Tax=Hexamita inflata TaxID=28002 RepID=A0ABP1HV61_9EUKA